MVYQYPLAFLLGLEGIALLRAFAGEYDREFGEARIAEIRRLLDDPALRIEGVNAERVGTVDGYRIWSQTYHRPGNGAFDYEEPYVREILDALPTGVALDAACVPVGGPPTSPDVATTWSAWTTPRTCSAMLGHACRTATSASATCTRCRSTTARSTSSCAPSPWSTCPTSRRCSRSSPGSCGRAVTW